MFNLDNSNWQKAGALRVYRKKSKSKKTSPKKRSSRRPSKKQLAALARGRAIRAKNIKKRRSGKKIQRGGRNPGTAATRRVAEEQRQLQAQEMQTVVRFGRLHGQCASDCCCACGAVSQSRFDMQRRRPRHSHQGLRCQKRRSRCNGQPEPSVQEEEEGRL